MPEDFSIKGFRPEDFSIGGTDNIGKINDVKGLDKQEKGDEGKFGVASQGADENNLQEVDLSEVNFDEIDFEDFDGLDASGGNIAAQNNTNVNQSSNSPADGDNMNLLKKDIN